MTWVRTYNPCPVAPLPPGSVSAHHHECLAAACP